MTIYTIDGNIGSGKSSILNYLHKYKNIQIDLEPLDKWKTFLDNIYITKTGYFNFQIKVWLDRTWIQEKDNNSVIFMERSPYFIRHTFNKYDYINSNINEEEFNVINEMYNKTDKIWNSNYYIYLRSNPIKCLERIKLRGRENEANIDNNYITDIHNLHEEALEELQKTIKVLIIDIENKSVEEIAEEILRTVQF